MGFATNDNGHHRELKFDNEDEHRRFHIDTFQTFLMWLHKQEQILNRLLRHVGYETIDDPMPNDRLTCAPLFSTNLFHTTIERHSRQAVLLQVLPFLLMKLEDLKA